MDVTLLENKLKSELSRLSGDVSLYVKFLNTKEQIAFNADTEFWAASVIKIPIACELFRQVSENRLSLDTRAKIKEENRVLGSGILKLLDKDDEFTYLDLVTLMLTVSDNSATNEVVDIIGWEKVEEFMKKLGLTNTTFRHKMMIKAGRGPNLTTSKDMGSLLEKLYNAELPLSLELLGILKDQQDRRRIPLLLPNDVEVAHKLGSLEKAMHDVGIIFSKNPFIFVFLSDDQEDKRLTNDVLSTCAKLCFDAGS